jgi:hypothetical protein
MTRSELWRDFDTLDPFDMVLDRAGIHTSRIEGDHGLGEVSNRRLPFGDDLRIEVPLRSRDVSIPLLRIRRVLWPRTIVSVI